MRAAHHRPWISIDPGRAKREKEREERRESKATTRATCYSHTCAFTFIDVYHIQDDSFVAASLDKRINPIYFPDEIDFLFNPFF